MARESGRNNREPRERPNILEIDLVGDEVAFHWLQPLAVVRVCSKAWRVEEAELEHVNVNTDCVRLQILEGTSLCFNSIPCCIIGNFKFLSFASNVRSTTWPFLILNFNLSFSALGLAIGLAILTVKFF